MEKSLEGEFIQSYFNVFGFFMKENANLSIASTHENIILPILNLVNKYNLPISLQISDYALNCDYAYQNVFRSDKLLYEKYNQFAHFHRRAGKLVKVIMKIIE